MPVKRNDIVRLGDCETQLNDLSINLEDLVVASLK